MQPRTKLHVMRYAREPSTSSAVVIGVRRFAAVVAIVCAACAPTNVPSAATAAASTPSVGGPAIGGTSVSCASFPTLATASVAPSPAPSGRALPSPAPPGTYLFEKSATALLLYSRGAVRELSLPAPLSGSRAVLAPDGSAAHAVLADVKAQRMSLWSSSGAQVALDIPFLGDVGIVSWSPDARHLAIVPDTDRVDAIYFAGFDQPASRFVPGGLVFDLEWRGADELSFFSASSRDYPISGATLWDWRAGERPQALVKLDLAGWSAWRSDGAVFAYPAVTADGTAAVRTLDVTGTAIVGDRTVLTADDVTRSKESCGWAAKDLKVTFIDWQGGGLLAVGLHALGQYDYAVAVVHEETGLRGIVRSNNSCFIPFAHWARATPILAVPLFGPECGETTLLNRTALVDKTGTVMREITVPRKGALLLSDIATWAAIPGENELTVLRVNGPEQRFVVPIAKFLGWCCAE